MRFLLLLSAGLIRDQKIFFVGVDAKFIFIILTFKFCVLCICAYHMLDNTLRKKCGIVALGFSFAKTDCSDELLVSKDFIK